MINKDMSHDEMRRLTIDEQDIADYKFITGEEVDEKKIRYVEADMEFNNITTNSKVPASGKVAIYARHSCNEEMLDKQVEELVRTAESVGDTHYVVYKEIAAPYAETYEQRDKMMEDIETQGIKRVYVKSRDRFCKDLVRSVEFAHKLVDAGIEITETKTLV